MIQIHSDLRYIIIFENNARAFQILICPIYEKLSTLYAKFWSILAVRIKVLKICVLHVQDLCIDAAEPCT